MPEVPREVRQGPFAGRMAGDVPENPYIGVVVVGPLPEPPERRGNERFHDVPDGGRHGRHSRRGLAANLPGAHDIAQGDDEWRLGARLEERLEALHRIVLGQEELDGVRLEQRAPIAHERQEVLAHPGGHYGEPVKKPSSRRRNIREN